MHAFPRPEQPYLSVERTPVEGTCPECGGDESRRVPRAERGWLVGRPQVPGLPRLAAPRARPAVRRLRPARARDPARGRGARCSASTSAARSPTSSRCATAASRWRRCRATRRRRPRPWSRARVASGSRAAPCSTTRARWGSTRSSRGGCRRSASSRPRATATCSRWAPCGGRSTRRPTRAGGAASATPRARSCLATCVAASPSGCSRTAAC